MFSRKVVTNLKGWEILKNWITFVKEACHLFKPLSSISLKYCWWLRILYPRYKIKSLMYATPIELSLLIEYWTHVI